MHVIKALNNAIKEKNCRIVVGIDPTFDIIPQFFKDSICNKCNESCHYTGSNSDCLKIFMQYCKKMVDALSPIIPAVKPNIAFFERYGATEFYFELAKYAKDRGLFVIADAKRADIGKTSKGYADAFLSKGSPIDMLTVNPYFGSDGIEPFVQAADKNGKGLFVLVKTSNKSSAELQDLITEDGRKVYEVVADLVSYWGRNNIHDAIGYSNIGAVVGATHKEAAKQLRQRNPNTFFLVPGYGAQGATAEDVAVNFDENGFGAIVNASSSILSAYKSPRWCDDFSEEEFCEAAVAEAILMRDLINDAIFKEKNI